MEPIQPPVNANADWYAALNDTPGRVGPPIGKPPESILQYFREWLDQDGYPFWSFWDNIKSWWEVQHLPNVLLLHYAELKRDMPGQIQHIADFLDIPIDAFQWSDILTHCSFDYMKQHAEQSVPLGGAFWEGGAKTFVYKGINGRWKELLSAEDIARYEAIALDRLGPDCAQWLSTGQI